MVAWIKKFFRRRLGVEVLFLNASKDYVAERVLVVEPGPGWRKDIIAVSRVGVTNEYMARRHADFILFQRQRARARGDMNRSDLVFRGGI